MKPIVRTCCCGCTLEQGTTAAGFFALVDVAVMLLAGTVQLYSVNHDVFKDWGLEEDMMVDQSHPSANNPAVVQGVMLFVVAVLFLGATLILFGCSLSSSEGTEDEFTRWNRRQMATLPWITIASIRVTSIVLQMFVFVARAAILYPAEVVVLTGTLCLLYGGTLAYLLIVVISYRQFLWENPAGVRNPQMNCQTVLLQL